MPRSRSRSIESSTCARMRRGSTVCVSSRMRSASVDLPWSMWAMIEKLRMWCWSAMGRACRLEPLQRLGEPPQQARRLRALALGQRLVEPPAPFADLVAPRGDDTAALRGQRDVDHAPVARARRARDEPRPLEAV